MGWVELSGLLLWILGREWIWISNLGRIILKYRLGGGVFCWMRLCHFLGYL
jgi:hypothetical protein